MIKLKNERGITLITLAVTVVVLVIITCMVSINSYTSLSLSRLTKLNNDVQALDDRIAAYFVEHEELPVFEETMQGAVYTYPNDFEKKFADRNSYDTEKYYTIDLSKLDNISLNYGSGYQSATSRDKYVINPETHSIYHLEGISYQGVVYHTASTEKLF